jgi:hypothetical protein
MKKALFSTALVFSISSLGAFGFYLFGVSFWGSFLLMFVFQYVTFSFLANIINNYFVEKTKQKQLEKLEPLSTILECAYCNSKNIMTFLPDENEKVEFDCASCKKKNSVNIQFVVARVTEPLNIPSVTGVPLVDDKKVS